MGAERSPPLICSTLNLSQEAEKQFFICSKAFLILANAAPCWTLLISALQEGIQLEYQSDVDLVGWGRCPTCKATLHSGPASTPSWAWSHLKAITVKDAILCVRGCKLSPGSAFHLCPRSHTQSLYKGSSPPRTGCISQLLGSAKQPRELNSGWADMSGRHMWQLPGNFKDNRHLPTGISAPLLFPGDRNETIMVGALAAILDHTGLGATGGGAWVKGVKDPNSMGTLGQSEMLFTGKKKKSCCFIYVPVNWGLAVIHY